MKRFLSLLLMLSLVLVPATLNSCGSKKDKETDSENKVTEEQGSNDIAQTTEPEITADIEKKDYAGHEFTILTRDDAWHTYPLHSRDIVAEKETGDSINDAVYKRNIEVQEMFNITIKMSSFPEITGDGEMGPNNALMKDVNAGTNSYDLLLSHELNAGKTAQMGYLYNWNDVPHVDLTKPWWCKSATDALSVGKNAFLALSDLAVSANDHCYIVLFNKELQKQYNTEDFYGLVKDGKWTFDKMYAVSKDIAVDVDGDTNMTKDDLFGLMEGGAQLNYFYAGGNMLTYKDENNIPYYNILTDRSITTFEKALEIISSPSTFSFDSWIDEKIVPMFAASHALLLTTQVGIISQLRGMEFDFGILPFPKLDEAQEKYYNYVDGHAQIMGIPKNASDIDRTGNIVEALSYYGNKHVVPAYYDVALKTKFSRDNESAEMLDYVFDGRLYDFDYIYGDWVIAFKFAEIVKTKKNTFVSTIEKTLPKAEKQLEKILAAYAKIEEEQQ